MKPIINRLTGYTTLFFMPFLLLRKKHLLLWFIIAIITVGCFQKYYSTGSTTQVNTSQIEELKRMNKVFILHYGDGNKAIRVDGLMTVNDSLTGMASALDKAHSKALTPVKTDANVVPGKALPDVLNEVHIYSNNTPTSIMGAFSVPLAGIYRMDVYAFDEKATKRSSTMSIIGIVAAVALIALTVIAVSGASAAASGIATGASTCGCPEVFIEEQGQYQYVNGVFSGALYSNMERSDFLPIGDIASGRNIKLEIRNTPKERQYIDQVELIAVQHSAGEKVLADRKGSLHSFSNEIPANTAIDESGADVRSLLSKTDDEVFRFNTDLQDPDLSSLVLEFDIPDGTGSTLLAISGRNSGWAAAMNKSFTQLFGKEYPDWRAKKEKDDPEDMEKWQLEQGLPIKVYVSNGSGWKYIDYFPLAGTMGTRDMAMLIDGQMAVGGKLKIKLETVFNFWEIDKISLALNTSSVKGRTVAFSEPIATLTQADKKYFEMDDQNTSSIVLNFSDPAWKEGTAYFLHARGYYHNEDFYPGEADRETLRKFRDAKAFSQFSKNQYRMYQEFMAARPK